MTVFINDIKKQFEQETGLTAEKVVDFAPYSREGYVYASGLIYAFTLTLGGRAVSGSFIEV